MAVREPPSLISKIRSSFVPGVWLLEVSVGQPLCNKTGVDIDEDCWRAARFATLTALPT
jgi:hypothetical protein